MEKLPMQTFIAVHEVEDIKRWLSSWKPGEFDGGRRKRVLVKIIGE
jgi:hypothetical protein